MNIFVRVQEVLGKCFPAMAQLCSKTESVYKGGMRKYRIVNYVQNIGGFMCELRGVYV